MYSRDCQSDQRVTSNQKAKFCAENPMHYDQKSNEQNKGITIGILSCVPSCYDNVAEENDRTV